MTICSSDIPVLRGDALIREDLQAMQEELRSKSDELASANRSLANLKAILDNIPELAWLKDAAGRYRAVNAAFGRASGVLPADHIGKTDLDLWPLDLAEHFRAHDAEVIRTGTRHCVVESLADREGDIRWIETTKTPIVDLSGRVIGTTGIARDITEQKNSESHKESLQAQLNQAQKMESVGQLAGGMAHDFNNLLTVIMANLNIMEAEHCALCAHAELVGEIREAAERAADLTRQLLAFSRQKVTHLRTVDLNDVCRKIRRMLKRVIGEDIRFDFLPCDTPLFSRLDSTQIEQVFVNLAVNARDAMPRGGVFQLETATARHDGRMNVMPRDGFVARVSARDTGTGIESVNLGRIFDPFFTTKDVGKGTGLGLSMAYGIVKQHGGEIAVQSDIGTGTTFTIYLPLCEEEESKPIHEKVELTTTPIVVATILLVEDEASVRRVTRRILEKAGHRVMEAVNPMDALAQADDPGLVIDLVLSDIVMPGMSGLDMMNRIRERQPGIKSLFMSGYAEKEILSRISSDTSIDYLAKPFTVDELARKIRSALDKN